MSELKVLGSYVLVQEIKGPEKTAAGIYLPNQENSQTLQGKVLAVGEGTWRGETLVGSSLKVGDTVYFHKGNSEEITHEGTTYRVMHDQNILAVVS